jgi:hypothetical protein
MCCCLVRSCPVTTGCRKSFARMRSSVDASYAFNHSSSSAMIACRSAFRSRRCAATFIAAKPARSIKTDILCSIWSPDCRRAGTCASPPSDHRRVCSPNRSSLRRIDPPGDRSGLWAGLNVAKWHRCRNPAPIPGSNLVDNWYDAKIHFCPVNRSTRQVGGHHHEGCLQCSSRSTRPHPSRCTARLHEDS